MTLPATMYSKNTIPNPTSALTDFSVMIDLANMGAGWWTANGTEADGTKGRAAKDDGIELATDWIDFDHAAETGWVRVKWSGTLATSGTQTIRVYPPVAGNSANAASATYGSDNAYDASVYAYLPLFNLTDRTSNSNDGTGGGSITAGGATGKVGDATNFDGTDDKISITKLQTADAISASVWVNLDTISGTAIAAGSDAERYLLYIDGTNVYSRSSVGGAVIGAHGGISTGTWYHLAMTRDASDNIAVFFNGSSVATGSNGFNYTVDTLGTFSDTDAQNLDGKMNEMIIHTAGRHADWIKYEYDQTNDNATFLGTWEVVAASSSNITAIMHHRRLIGVS